MLPIATNVVTAVVAVTVVVAVVVGFVLLIVVAVTELVGVNTRKNCNEIKPKRNQ